jgi:hypothetical protein
MTDDEWSFEARQARDDARRLAAWKERQRGRSVRLWTADIEVRAAALDAQDAWWRLAVYMRYPCHRIRTALLHHPADLELSGLNQQPAADDPDRDRELELAAVVEPAERVRLELDYPRAELPRPARWEAYGPSQRADVAEYAAALRHGAGRLLGELSEAEEAALAARPPLPPGTVLGVWRAVHQATFLAGEDEASARARAQELAATIVDWAGRPLGRVLRVAPDDGFRSARDGRWLHPAETSSWETLEDLWADHEAGERTVGDPAALAGVLRRAAEDLEREFTNAIAAHVHWDIVSHQQPDGSRTLSSPAELEAVDREVEEEAAGKSRADLLRLADEADYLADRVYGKSVQNDAEFKRVERFQQRAKAFRQLAAARVSR